MGKADALAVEYRPLDSLIPYARNSRTHSDEQVAQIAGSIKEFGFTNPILIDEDGGIIAGHGRVLASQRLKLKKVPTITLRGLTPAQKRAYVITDNKLPLNAGWDSELLSVELDELRDVGFDLSLIGFSQQELNDLIGTPNVPPLPGMPELPNGERAPFQQMTFTLHDSQAEAVKAAIELANACGGYDDSVNQNSNGNALARICQHYIDAHADS